MAETLRDKRRRAGQAGGRATAARLTNTGNGGARPSSAANPAGDDDGLVFGNAAQLREMAEALEGNDTRTLANARTLSNRRVTAWRTRHPKASTSDLAGKVVCDTALLDAPRATGPRLRVTNQHADTAEMWIYDYIDGWGAPSGISAAEIVEELGGITAPNLVVHMNSGGGDVFEGIAIKRALAAHAAHVYVSVDSLAASIASVIAMAGDTIGIDDAGMFMIHEASGFAYGNAADMHSMANLLDKVSDVIAGVYADRAGGDTKDWRTRMLAETWYTATEAIEAGLADKRLDDPDEDEDAEDDVSVAASVDPDLFLISSFAATASARKPVDPNPDFDFLDALRRTAS